MNKTLLKEIDSFSKSGRTTRQILSFFIKQGPSTITKLTKHLDMSIPTVTKLVAELVANNTLKDYGKLETSGGRFPTLYGVNPDAGFFIGVDVKHNSVSIGMTNFSGDSVKTKYNIPYTLENTQEKLDELCNIIQDFVNEVEIDTEEILNININLLGRINPDTGFSYTVFNFDPEVSLAERISQRLNLRVSIDNDTRGMTYGEYLQGNCNNRECKNILYLNVSWGIGLGIIMDGNIYMGKSGFSGEFGHIGAYDNEILCRCGKKGCIETEASGQAMQRLLTERIRSGEVSLLSEKVLSGQELTLQDIINAAQGEDMLTLQVLNEIGVKLGRQVSSLINLFNPELVIIGGSLSLIGDQLAQTIHNEVRTYSLNLVSRDTEINTAILGERAGLIGACEMARMRRFQ